MADYSGAHYTRCEECGAAGSSPAELKHTLVCGEPQRQQRLLELDAEARRLARRIVEQERLQAWRSLDDEDLLGEVRLTQELAASKHREWAMLEERLRLGLKVLDERGLVSKWRER